MTDVLVPNAEIVTVAHARAVGRRDELKGELINLTAYYALNSQWVLLYDPPDADGEFVVDGDGEPAQSLVSASQAIDAVERGFTEAPPRTARQIAAAERKEEREEEAEEKAVKSAARSKKATATRKRNERAVAKQKAEADSPEEVKDAPEPAHDPVTPMGEMESIGDNRFVPNDFRPAPQTPAEGSAFDRNAENR